MTPTTTYMAPATATMQMSGPGLGPGSRAGARAGEGAGARAGTRAGHAMAAIKEGFDRTESWESRNSHASHASVPVLHIAITPSRNTAPLPHHTLVTHSSHTLVTHSSHTGHTLVTHSSHTGHPPQVQKSPKRLAAAVRPYSSTLAHFVERIEIDSPLVCAPAPAPIPSHPIPCRAVPCRAVASHAILCRGPTLRFTSHHVSDPTPHYTILHLAPHNTPHDTPHHTTPPPHHPQGAHVRGVMLADSPPQRHRMALVIDLLLRLPSARPRAPNGRP